MSILSEIAKENGVPAPGECLLFFFEEKHASVFVFEDKGRSGATKIGATAHLSSRTDYNKLIRYLENSDVSSFGQRSGNRIDFDYTKRTRHKIDHDLRLVVEFIVQELGYE